MSRKYDGLDLVLQFVFGAAFGMNLAVLLTIIFH